MRPPVQYFNLPNSGTDDIEELTQTSNIGITGLWIYRVDGIEIGSKFIILFQIPNCHKVASQCHNQQSIALNWDPNNYDSVDLLIFHAWILTHMHQNVCGYNLDMTVANGNTPLFQGACCWHGSTCLYTDFIFQNELTCTYEA